MLPNIIDNTETHTFQISRNGGLGLVFASAQAFAPGGPLQVLWAQETPDERTLLALQRWVAVRRYLWESWGRLAEAVGQSAFVRHMEKLLTEQPIGEVTGTVVHRDQDDDHAIVIGELVSSRAGLKTEELYRHRFGSSQLRERFFEWLYTGDNLHAAEELVHIGFNVGTDAVAEALDTIAALPDDDVAVAPIGRKSAGRRRRPS